MNRLQLATLLSWAGSEGLKGRKRLQKVVYLLQQAGCPLDCQFILHHYGPYSRDVADVCDEMASAGLVEESMGTMQYTYKLSPRASELLAAEQDPQLQPFQNMAESLIAEDIWTLELGSTIALFKKQGQDWDGSLQRACEFKNVKPEDGASKRALALAKRVVA